MDGKFGLNELRAVIHHVYNRICEEVPTRSQIPFDLGDLVTYPMVTFKAGYIELETRIGGDSERWSHWTNIQMQVMTILNGDDESLKLNYKMVGDTLMGTPGGSNADLFVPDGRNKVLMSNPPRSLLIALAFRVFIDDLDTPPPLAKPGQVPPNQGAKK